MINSGLSKLKSNFGFIDFLEEVFIEGQVYTSSAIKTELKRGINKFQLFKLKPNLKLLKEYFHISDERVSAGKDENDNYQKGYIIGKRKMN